jgi:enediyne biosynthesis protein E7
MLVENWQNYVKGPNITRVALLLGKGLMVSKGNLWKRQRRMIQPAFTQESVARSVKLIVSTNSALLRKWQLAADANEAVNVTKDVSNMALEVVLRLIFSEDYKRVAPHFDILSTETARNIEFARTFRALGKIILQIVEERRAKPSPPTGLLDMLMRARDPESGKQMPDDQLVDEVLTLIVAGHETTASTLSWCWYLLSQHPDEEEKLSNELGSLVGPVESLQFSDLSKFPYTRQILEETMRLFPAGWIVTRKALHDDQLGEYFVRAGTEVYIVLYSIHRHPALWEEPDRFDPDRFRPERMKDRHRLAAIPFSAGPRNCIGALFARTEMQIHLMTIAKHLRLRYEQSKPIEFDAGVNLRSKYDFIMYPEVRKEGLQRSD